MMWNNFEFKYPAVLLLLIILPILYLYYKQYLKTNQSRIIFPGADKISQRLTWRIRYVQYRYLLKLLSICSIIIALARPQSMLKEEQIEAEGIDIFMVMDLSSSMLSRDFSPNRLEVSKRVAIDFVKNRPYDRIGLVAFSGEAFTQSPLTTDHDILVEFLQQLQCGFLEDGTAIGMGMSAALNRIKDSPSKTKVLILLTDGVNNSGYISPQTAGEIAKTLGIRVYTIGVGTLGEAESPIGRRPDGSFVFGYVPVEIGEGVLTQIAQETGAKYFRATNAEQLTSIYSEIDALEKTKIEIKTFKRYSEEFRPFVFLALALLIIDVLLYYGLIKRLL